MTKFLKADNPNIKQEVEQMEHSYIASRSAKYSIILENLFDKFF